MQVSVLGEARFPSPVGRTVNEQRRVPARLAYPAGTPPEDELSFEVAGPRPMLYFDRRPPAPASSPAAASVPA